MSRPRFDNLSETKRSRLLDAASEEFAANGYDGASLNRILDRSGMSKSSLYYYFDDKADLFTTLVERSLGLLLRRIGGFDAATLTAESYWPELEALYRRSLTLVSADSWYVKLGRLFYRLRGNAGRTDPTARLFDRARGWVSALLARGQTLGTVRTDLPPSLLVELAMGLGETLDRWVVEHWDEIGEDARARLPAEHIALFRALLAPR